MRDIRAGTAATGGRGPIRRPDEHDALLLGLTLVAALTDAISYLGLDRVFPANMTGNTVLLGLGIASHDLPAAARSATALGAFLAGAVLAAVLLRRPGWSRASVGLLIGETAALTALCTWWLALGEPSGAATYGLIGLAGVSMGAQSGLASRLNVPGVTTTYITGTWTALSIALVDRLLHRRGPGRQHRHRHGVQLLVVTGYLAGALAGGYGYRAWHGTPPPSPALTHHRHSRHRRYHPLSLTRPSGARKRGDRAQPARPGLTLEAVGLIAMIAEMVVQTRSPTLTPHRPRQDPAPAEETMRLALLRDLLHRPVWSLGSGVDI